MRFYALLIMLVVPVPVMAQEGAAQPVSMPTSVSVGMRVGDLPSNYDDGGRRDPFATLVMPKRAAAGTGGRLRPGLSNMVLADVVVRGIIRSGSAMFAILETPGKQSYIAHVKDKLSDAVIQSIDANGVVFLESDGSGSPANKVRKELRSAEDAGEEDR